MTPHQQSESRRLLVSIVHDPKKDHPAGLGRRSESEERIASYSFRVPARD